MATQDTQQRILERAVELFNVHGSRAVSLNRIADACEISSGNLHYHFRTKDDVVLAIFDRIKNDASQVAERDLATPTLEHMRFMFERYASLVWRYRFFFRELSALTESNALLRRRYFENRRVRLAALEAFFERLIAVGRMRRPEPPVTVATLVALSWIVSDNFLFYQEGDRPPGDAPGDAPDAIDPALLDAGYAMIVAIFQPYLAGA